MINIHFNAQIVPDLASGAPFNLVTVGCNMSHHCLRSSFLSTQEDIRATALKLAISLRSPNSKHIEIKVWMLNARYALCMCVCAEMCSSKVQIYGQIHLLLFMIHFGFLSLILMYFYFEHMKHDSKCQNHRGKKIYLANATPPASLLSCSPVLGTLSPTTTIHCNNLNSFWFILLSFYFAEKNRHMYIFSLFPT